MGNSLALPAVAIFLLFSISAHEAACGNMSIPDQAISSDDSTEAQTPPRLDGIVGRISTEDGRPIAGATITLRSIGSAGPPVPDLALVSQEDGTFHWPIEPGLFEINVTHPGYQAEHTQVVVRSDAPSKVKLVLRSAD